MMLPANLMRAGMNIRVEVGTALPRFVQARPKLNSLRKALTLSLTLDLAWSRLLPNDLVTSGYLSLLRIRISG